MYVEPVLTMAGHMYMATVNTPGVKVQRIGKTYSEAIELCLKALNYYTFYDASYPS